MSLFFAADSSPLVDWGALGQVALISVIAGILVASILGVGVIASLRASDERERGNGSTAVSLNVVTGVAVLLVAAAVVVGIYYIAHKS
jgi:ABC-type siderophore export system fused ATPase/permease subunit